MSPTSEGALVLVVTLVMLLSGVPVAFGLGAIIFALGGSYWIALGALFVMGAGDAMSVFVRSTVVQLATPEDMRGRVSAIHVLFVGCTNELGEFRAGLLAALFGAVPAALAGGFGTLAIVALWTQLFPGLRRVDRLSEVTPQSDEADVELASPRTTRP